MTSPDRVSSPPPPLPPLPPPPPAGLFKRLLRGLLAIIAAIWLFAEEWLWDVMLAAMAWLGRLPPVRWIESRIASLPPYPALLAFIIPAAVLLPFKFAAFWLIAQGQALLGAALFIVAKVIGTALLARIFALTKPALLSVDWFRRAYEAVIRWKARVNDYVKSLPLYRRIQALRQLLREEMQRLKNWWR